MNATSLGGWGTPMVPSNTDGPTHVAVARRLGASLTPASEWRRRFQTLAWQGLCDGTAPELRRRDHGHGNPPQDAVQLGLRWGLPRVAEAEGDPTSTVQRWYGVVGVRAPLDGRTHRSRNAFRLGESSGCHRFRSRSNGPCCSALRWPIHPHPGPGPAPLCPALGHG